MICDLCEEKEANCVATKDSLILAVCTDCGAKLVEARGFSCCKVSLKQKEKTTMKCEICEETDVTHISHYGNTILYVCLPCGIKLLDKNFNLRKVS